MSDSKLIGQLLENPRYPLPGAMHYGVFFPLPPSSIDPLLDGQELHFLPLPNWPRITFQQPWRKTEAGQWCKFRWLGFPFTLTRLVREPGLVVEQLLTGPAIGWTHRRRLIPEAQGTLLLEEFVLNPGPLSPLAWFGILPAVLSKAFEDHHQSLGKWLSVGTQFLSSSEVTERLEALSSTGESSPPI